MQLDTTLSLDKPLQSRHKEPAQQSATSVLDLSIVIVNWNTQQVIIECLESVYDRLGELHAEVIVIDNASTDNSVKEIATKFPQVRLIANDTNRGFAGANNQGMEIATGRFVLLLNPDTVVLDDAFANSINYLNDNPDVGVVGCQVMEDAETIQRTCFRYPSILNTLMWVSGALAWKPLSRITGRAAYGPWDRRNVRDVEVVSGMFMLVRREALEEVGFMDEEYFVFAEEADWCYRFSAAGWRCVFAPVGRILHVDGGSKSTKQASVRMYVQIQKSLLLFHRKHLGFTHWALCKLLFITTMLIRMLWWLIWAALGIGERSAHKAKQSAAAVRYHLTGKEPNW
ncbi:MAG: glycosyltransferase family 2 protein [Planctomycetes bacterium]|nr:glycosyltransferase family 2 protein [Planctomycetota bacterium]